MTTCLHMAQFLVHAQPPSEVFLRRAVSSAYYAVFHLLILESAQHRDKEPLRTTLGRAYDHALMKTASNRILDVREFPYIGEKLKEIAQGFGQLQEDRHFADYNLTEPLDPGDALRQVNAAEKIFVTLPAINREQIVQQPGMGNGAAAGVEAARCEVWPASRGATCAIPGPIRQLPPRN